MRKALVLLFLCTALTASAQTLTPTVSAAEAIAHALHTSSITDNGIPFHAILHISYEKDEPNNIAGTVEIFWRGPDVYRTVVTSREFSQTRIVHGNDVEEHNTGDFCPLWLQNYVSALMNPLDLPNAMQRLASTVKSDDRVGDCIGIGGPGGYTNDITVAHMCFIGVELRLEHVMEFAYNMGFKDYKPFGAKSIARTYERYMDWTTPSRGNLLVLEPLVMPNPLLFTIVKPTPLADRIETTLVSTLTAEPLQEQTDDSPWPPVNRGKTEGDIIVRVVTDRNGQVRFAHKFNSDNVELEDEAVIRALHYKFKPLQIDGVPHQMVTPIVMRYATHLARGFPFITGNAISGVASGCGTASLPSGLWPSGKVFHIQYGVDQAGKVTTTSFPEANDNPGVPHALMNAAWRSVQSCRFYPYEQNGKPTEYIVLFAFTAP